MFAARAESPNEPSNAQRLRSTLAPHPVCIYIYKQHRLGTNLLPVDSSSSSVIAARSFLFLSSPRRHDIIIVIIHNTYILPGLGDRRSPRVVNGKCDAKKK